MMLKRDIELARKEYEIKNPEATKFWNDVISGKIVWSNIAYDLIPIDKAKQLAMEEDKLIKQQEIERIERIESERNLNAWEELELDTFHLDLIKYKESHSNDDFNKIYPTIKKMVRQVATKYIKKLPMKAKQIYLTECNAEDYSEFCTELMLKAIENWNPDKHVKFSTYLDRVIYNWVGGIKTMTKHKYYQETSILSLDKEIGIEELMNDLAKQHYRYDENLKMFMNTYIEMFVNHLNKIDKCLGLLFYALVTNNLTHQEIAKYMSVSTKTVQRKVQIIKNEWNAYTSEIK